MATITVLAPDYEGARTTAVETAPRAHVFEPAVLTIIENGKPNAKALLRYVADELSERLPLARVDVFSKPSAGKPITSAEAKLLAARSRLVLTGLGD